MLSADIKQRIDELVSDNNVVLFMKGKRRLPQCGFSAQVVSVLDQLVEEYVTVNVLDDNTVREGIKSYSNWPTIPQLYVNGKFVGGCDIVTAMFDNGQLHELLGRGPQKIEPPQISISDGARNALKDALKEEGDGLFVRLMVDQNWRPGLDMGKPESGDFQLTVNEIPLVVDRATAQRADGLSIDFVPGEAGGFKINNPSEPARVKGIAPKDLKARLDAGEKLEIFDVRTDHERSIARIEGTRLLDQQAAGYIDGLDREKAVLVFHCRSGGRSMAAAEHFLGQGFKQVFNLTGGINAWSRDVDPDIPVY